MIVPGSTKQRFAAAALGNVAKTDYVRESIVDLGIVPRLAALIENPEYDMISRT